MRLIASTRYSIVQVRRDLASHEQPKGAGRPSERWLPHDRKLNKALGIRERLGQKSGGTLAPFPAKPNWMRWHTYQHLREQVMALERELWGGEGAEARRHADSRDEDRGPRFSQACRRAGAVRKITGPA